MTPDPKMIRAHADCLRGWTGINPLRKAEERLDEARTTRDRDLWRAVISELLKGA